MRRHVGRGVRRLVELSRHDRAAGITLSVATVAALIWANASLHSYERTWDAVPSLGHRLGLAFSWRDWTNQGLMTVFFTFVGLEIRREVTSGALASWRRASVPVIAAAGGMLVPATIYAAVVHGGEGSRGWGIPMATDVAFAVGALALVGAGRSPRLRVFLMTLAVADDIGSVIILICFYGSRLRVGPLVLGVACIAAMAALEWVRPAWIEAQLLLGIVGWWGLARGGAEAAVIGVAIGLWALPSPVDGAWARLRGPRGWERRIEPWLSLLVLPVFAVANAGVSVRGIGSWSTAAVTVFVAVVAARIIGKPAGIGATTVLMRERSASVPMGRDLLGVGALAGIGFTVPLLVIRAALPAGPLTDSATLGLLVATALAAIVSFAVLRAERR